MKLACAPKSVITLNGQDIRFQLFNKRTVASEGEAAASMLKEISRLGLAPDRRAWDFLSIALAVIAADETCPRSASSDGWSRSIQLTVAVSDPQLWSEHLPAIETALGFLSTDRWRITLIEGGIHPTPGTLTPRPEQCICLFSGGLDSLVGAIDLVSRGQSPLLVSQIAKGDKAKQKQLAEEVAGVNHHIQLNHNAKPPRGFSERSQRARSLIFIAYAVLAATSLDRYKNGDAVKIYIPENGYISLNIPLTPMRLASHSTRTTHPFYLDTLEAVFAAVGLRVTLHNPYQFNTKGEMLSGCANQQLLIACARNTTSCGRFARNAFKHCGRCVPCLIRRAAFQSWGTDPTPTYKYFNLGIRDHAHSGFDDVRSMGIAVATAQRRGIEVWIGAGLSMLDPGERVRYVGVLDRGLREIGTLLKKMNVT